MPSGSSFLIQVTLTSNIHLDKQKQTLALGFFSFSAKKMNWYSFNSLEICLSYHSREVVARYFRKTFKKAISKTQQRFIYVLDMF